MEELGVERNTFVIWSRQTPRWIRALVALALVLFIGSWALWLTLMSPPLSFPRDTIITIDEGLSVSEISHQLRDQGLVHAPRAFMLWVRFFHDSKIQAGDYVFQNRLGILFLTKRLASGDYGDSRVRVWIPEGLTVIQIGERLEEQLSGFDAKAFKELALPYEGYLFPDTYFMFPATTPERALEIMRDNFELQTAAIQQQIASSTDPGLSFDEVVTLASIIQREAYGRFSEQRTVAGIMLKRMSIDMALQVDATFVYERGLTSAQLTTADLREDSPYNTYTNKGLPPTPISNPGLNAMLSVLDPIRTDYLFYLHDRSAQVHYARTHAEHVANKNKYLR